MAESTAETAELDHWFAEGPGVGELPWADRLRIAAGMQAKSLPEPLAREVQLTLFRTTVRVFATLSILAAIATTTVILTLVPLDRTATQQWVIIHVTGYFSLLFTTLWLRRQLAASTLTLRRLNFALIPNAIWAALLWGTLPLVVGSADIDSLYLAIAVAGIFGAIGFFWPLGDWPVSFVYGVTISITLGFSYIRLVPENASLFVSLLVIMMVGLTTLGALAADGLMRSTFDSVIARDRQQFIDLLLRDHERGGLDFLWETDDHLHFGPIPPRMLKAARGDSRIQQGKSLLDLIDDPSTATMISNRRPFDTTVFTRGPEGRGQIRLSGRPRAIGGGEVGYRGVGSDAATARRADEAERIRDRLDTMVSLTGGLAHDFNNQLATILGAVELAQLDPGLNDQTTTVLSRAVEACLRTRRITSDLVTASGQSTTYDPEVFAVTEAVDQAIADLRLMFRDLTIELRSSTSVWVETDRTQFMRTVRNLIENACQAVLGHRQPIGDPPHVSVTIAEEWTSEANFAVTTVSDTGPGFNPVQLDMMFEPFFTTREGEGGTGLGLSTARGFAHQAHGTLRATNKTGGAELQLRIPSVPAPASSPSAPRSPRSPDFAPQINGLVLIVEDDPNVANNLRYLLEGLGARVEIVGSVGEAIGGYADRIDELECVISDIVLPDGEGFEVIAAFRKLRPDLKAVYMSGFSRTLPSTVSPELRCPFLPKPFSAAEFVGSLQSAGIGAQSNGH